MTDRRAFLTAALAAPIALSAPAYAANHYRPAWEIAVAGERHAFNEMEEVHATKVRPLDMAHRAGKGSFDAVVEAEEMWSKYTIAHARAVNNLIMTPAPDLAAVQKKLEMGIRDCAFGSDDQGEAMLKVILEDVRRLNA